MARPALTLIALAALAGGACRTATATRTGPSATDAAAESVRAAPGTRLVCRDERPTGSNIPVRTCYRVLDDVQRDHARDATIDALNAPHAQMRGGN